MEKSTKRGKIPQADWPSIMVRYEAGETLASIAKTYDCSPPAISYIVSRSRARQPNGEAAAPAPAEPHLVKANAGELVGDADKPTERIESHPPAAVTVMPPAGEPPRPHHLSSEQPDNAAERHGERSSPNTPRNDDGNGFAANGTREAEPDSGFPGLPPRVVPPRSGAPVQPAAAQGDRRTLHLSLGNGHGSHNGAGADSPAPTVDNSAGHSHQSQSAASSSSHSNGGDRFGPRPPGGPQRPHEQGRYAFPPASAPERSQFTPNGRNDTDHRKPRDTAGSFIDQELRTRVDSDIAAFLLAFDAALAADTQDSRSALREATDRLLRAGARTRIELERLEARVPLTPRDVPGRIEPAWRPR
jgi:hypothetical protein